MLFPVIITTVKINQSFHTHITTIQKLKVKGWIGVLCQNPFDLSPQLSPKKYKIKGIFKIEKEAPFFLYSDCWQAGGFSKYIIERRHDLLDCYSKIRSLEVGSSLQVLFFLTHTGRIFILPGNKQWILFLIIRSDDSRTWAIPWSLYLHGSLHSICKKRF